MLKRSWVAFLAISVAACGPERLEKTEADLAAAVTAATTRGDTATLWLYDDPRHRSGAYGEDVRP